MALMRERDPRLTQQEALARIVEELREMRERFADHEDQLTGLKSYGDMAQLNPAGLTGKARPGSGLSESSDLARALEGAWDVDDDDVHTARCDQAALGKFSDVTRSTKEPNMSMEFQSTQSPRRKPPDVYLHTY